MTTHRPVPTLVLALLCALAAALVPASAARAGTYVVRACGSDGVNRAFWAYANPGLSASVRCPANDYDGRNTGLLTRTEPSNARLPNGASAWHIFEAPGGTSLDSITFRASTGRASGCWTAGVIAWNGSSFHPGSLRWGDGANCSRPGGGFTWFANPQTVGLQGYDRVRVGVRCDSASGCPLNSQIWTWASLKDVAVTVRDDGAPTIAARGGALLDDGWHRGTESLWGDFSDASGIRAIDGRIDGALFQHQDFTAAGWPAAITCDYARPRPCSDIANGGAGLDTTSVADGVHALRVAAVDAAGNVGPIDRTIRIDNHAPAPPRGVTAAGGEGWRRANGFDVSWQDPPGQVAPVARAHWRLCRVEASADCREGVAPATEPRALAGLQVPAAGDWKLGLWLEDEAGNVDPAQAAEHLHLRLDDVAPQTAGFDVADPGDPRRVTLSASDPLSGLASARVELRRRGSGDWRLLPTTLDPAGRVAARIPDGELPDGAYELRAIVRDAAGNETLADRDVTGRAMTLVLPLRLPTRIVGRATGAPRCHVVRRRSGRRTISRRVCERPIPPATAALGRPVHIAFGRTGLLSAVLETWQGRPVGGVAVRVLQRPRTSTAWRAAGVARTDASGRLAWRIPRGPSRAVRLAFDGDDLLLPAGFDARTLVPAAGTLRVDRRRARNGASVMFTGRLLGLPIPPGERTIDLQAHYRGAWRTFATPRTDRRGRWRQAYRFGATHGRVLYRFRALVKRDGAYPYEQGSTPTVRVVVTG